MDTLSLVIERLAISASTFFSGVLCKNTAFSDGTGPGHLHLLREGQLVLKVGAAKPQLIDQPSVILFTAPLEHRFEVAESPGVELVCAEIELQNGDARLLPFGIPNPLIVSLAEAKGLQATLELLFDEAFDSRIGSGAAINRLMELLIVLVLRHCCETRDLMPGLLAGLADPQLSKALLVMHDSPGQHWKLEELAAAATMSRARFAAKFKACLGVPPGAYLTSLRVAYTQSELRLGRPLKAIAAEAGYANATALARAFKQCTGKSPRAWLAS